MELTALEIVIASLPDREECVAEVWLGNSQICELNLEYGEPVVELYPNPAGGAWILDHATFLNALAQAAEKLRPR